MRSILFFLISFSAFAQDVNERRWLILFSSDDGHPEFTAQKDIILSNQEEFIDRKIALIWVNQKNQVVPLFNSPSNFGSLTQRMNQFQSSEKSDFQVFLIGLDGGVKYRSNRHIAPLELIQLIDDMPMRRQEIHQRN